MIYTITSRYLKVGWVDSEKTVDTNAIMADIGGLPPALSLSLQDTLPMCMNRSFTIMLTHIFKWLQPFNYFAICNLLRSMEATLENVFSSGEFGATAALQGQDGAGSSSEECSIDLEPEQVSL